MKRAYGLTARAREAVALNAILRECESTAMEPMVCSSQGAAVREPGASAGADPLALYDDDGNGRITCREARAHGIAPVHRSDPAYGYMRDGDGLVCELECSRSAKRAGAGETAADRTVR